MKGYKALVPIGLAACLVLSFYMLFSTRMTTISEYNKYLKDARYYAKQEIAVDALVNYNKALEINNSIDIYSEVGEFFVKLDDLESAIAWGERMIEQFPNSSVAYEYLLSRYKEINDFHRCYALYDTIVKREASSAEIEAIMEKIRYVFYFGEAYDEVSIYSEGYCAVRYEDYWGLVDEVGDRVSPFKFKEIGPFIDGLAPVRSDKDEWYFIDNEGNKKFVALVDGNVTKLTSAVGDVYAAYDGTAWNFYNKSYKKISGGYAETTLLANSVVGVQQDGQWMILNEHFENVTGKKYIDLIKDDRGIICRNGIMFVNEGDGYFMIDMNGNKVTDQKYLNACLFMDTTYAAVETDKGWTFVDASGKMVFLDTYFDDARSFVNGFAAVKKSGKWGYIDMNGQLAIDYQFRGACDFNAKGCAFVEYEDIWQILRLYSKNYDT